MKTHEIRHRLTKINKSLVVALRECGYTSDYAEAMRKTIVEICQLGDALDKEGE